MNGKPSRKVGKQESGRPLPNPLFTEPPTSEDRAYMARDLVLCTLPHRDPGDVPIYKRQNGRLSLLLRPGWDSEANQPLGYPYGSIPRLLLFWITAEAVRKKSRRLELGDSLSQFMRELGLNPRNGTSVRSDARRLRVQMERLFRASITFEESEGSDTRGRKSWIDMQVAPSGELWWDFQRPDDRTFWGSWVELGEKFYQAITASPVPLDMRALRALKRSPLALDLYAWIAFRTYTVRRQGREAVVPWPLLAAQFGSEYEHDHHFRAAVREALAKIRKVYPNMDVEALEAGLVVRSGVLPVRPTTRPESLR